MKNVLIIAKRELGSYFSSPVAYVFLVIFLLLTGFYTFTAESYGFSGTSARNPGAMSSSRKDRQHILGVGISYRF